MAVELRCPKCKAKLSLRVEPEPYSEIECPKCAHVFPCEDNIVHAGEADEEPKRKKKSAAAESDEKPKKDEKKDAPEEKKDGAKPPPEQKKKRKRRKAKKRKTSNKVMIAIITGVVLVVGSVAGVLIWFFTKKSASQEMMTYLPADSSIVVGINLGHMKKYPDFYKAASGLFANSTFKKTGDLFAKALGNDSIDDVIDYVVQGAGVIGDIATGRRFDATVMRTKEEYDTSLLSKMPGAKEYTLSGVKYYTLPDDVGYPGLRVFAPTNRLVVFCSGDTIPADKFKAMLNGNKDNMDATPYARSGPLGKQVIRGTVWQFHFLPESGTPSITNFFRPAPVHSTTGGNDEEFLLWQEIEAIRSGAKCSGYKASVGSRETRGEWFVWYDSSEAATAMRKKWRERDFIKDEEKEVPRWFKSMAQKSGCGKTAENVIRDGLDFKASGELFSVRTSAETKLLQGGIGSLVTQFIGSSQSFGGGNGPGGTPMPGPGGKPPGGGGAMPPMPGPGGKPPGGGPGGLPPGRPRRSGFPGRRRSARTIPVR
jgi:phage FluMu protein Com